MARGRRDEAARLRSLLWEVSALDRVRKCGWHTVSPTGQVAVRLAAGVAGFSGVAVCGSVWACPVCNRKIMARRAAEIAEGVAGWQAQGHHVAMLTLTLRHTTEDRLGALWGGLTASWAKVIGGRVWRRTAKAHGIAGWLRATEVTHGANGWHVHLHVLLFLDRRPVAGDLDTLRRGLVERWTVAVTRAGLAAPTAAGQDLRLLEGPADAALGRYLTKATAGEALAGSIAREVTHSQGKVARTAHSTITPWALLGRFQQTGEARDLGLWREYERASHGRRQMTWAKGMRDLLALEPEATDEAIAEEELGSAADDLVLLPAESWRVVRFDVDRRQALLAAAEMTGLPGLRLLLDRWGLVYLVPDRHGGPSPAPPP